MGITATVWPVARMLAIRGIETVTDLDDAVRAIVRDELRAAGPRRPSEKALTVRDAAKRLSVDPKTIRRLIQRGELRAVHVGSKALRVLASDIDAMLAQAEKMQ